MGIDEKKHIVSLEEQYFEEFVLNSIESELDNKDELKREVLVNNTPKLYYDAFLANGVPYVDMIPKKGILLEIIYANRLPYIKEKIDRYSNSGFYLCLITFSKENYFYENYAILGFPYVKELAKRNPLLWWNFLAKIDEDANIVISDNGESASMKGNVLGSRGIEAVIEVKDIYKLSDMNFNDYKYKLHKGSYPSMILGNGVSIPFGSDSWSKVSETLFDYLSPLYLDNLSAVKKIIGDSNYFAASMSKTIISKSKYNEALKQCIYRKYEPSMHTSNTLLRSVVKAKIKYINMPLLTYNYDTFLEEDFSLYKHSKIMPVCDESEDKLYSEPKIKHVHGFCENIFPANPKNIILTDEEYFNEYKENNWVVNSQKHALKGFSCIYVGSSMSDLFQLSIIDEVKKELNKDEEYYKLNGIWYCYALVCLKNLTPKDILTINNYYIRKSIRLIFVDDFDKLPRKLDELFK